MRVLLFLFSAICLISSLIFGKVVIEDVVNIAILEPKGGDYWRSEEINELIDAIEAGLRSRGKFFVISRYYLKDILEERKLSEIGITEAIEFGKLKSARFVILPVLGRIYSKYDPKLEKSPSLSHGVNPQSISFVVTKSLLEKGYKVDLKDILYYAYAELYIKIFDISTGELIANEKFYSIDRGPSSTEARFNAIKALRYAFTVFFNKFFVLRIKVLKVEGYEVTLKGPENLLKPCGLFRTTSGGYILVKPSENGEVRGKILYGEVREGENAYEYFPILAGDLGGSNSGRIISTFAKFSLDLSIIDPMNPSRTFSNILSDYSKYTMVNIGLEYLCDVYQGFGGFEITASKYEKFGNEFSALVLRLGIIGEEYHWERIFINRRLSFGIGFGFDISSYSSYSFMVDIRAGFNARFEFSPSFGVMTILELGGLYFYNHEVEDTYPDESVLENQGFIPIVSIGISLNFR